MNTSNKKSAVGANTSTNVAEIDFERAKQVGTNVALQSTSGHYIVGGEVKAINPEIGLFTTMGESKQVSHNHAILDQPTGFTIIQQVYSSEELRYNNSRD
jgi:hypothetical protein